MKISLTFLIIMLLFSGCSWSAPFSPSRSTEPVINNSPAMQQATMRPYKINGKTYYPTVVSIGDTSKGIASWYGPDFHGKKTSNGETYNMYDMTAAHKTLPMNTMVKVINLNNRQDIVVRINDRGPFVNGRIIDLSKTAANKIGIIGTGTAPVMIQVVGFYGSINNTNNKTEIPNVIEGGSFMVQIGAFRSLDGAMSYKKTHNEIKGYKTSIKTYMLDDKPIHRVFLMGFRSEAEALDFAKSGGSSGAFIVRN